jgi:hypothetical protein
VTLPDSEPAPLRIPFRICAGLLALLMLLITAGALLQQFFPGADTLRDRAWLAMIAITFGFGTRYFGCFAITGRPPRRPPRTAWRTALDVAFGLAATFTIAFFITGWIGSSITPVATVLYATFVLVFARAIRSYWEHGRASVRRERERGAG